MPTPIKLKRYTGSAYEILQPETTWSQVTDKPSTFTPTAHTHVVADITDNSTLVKTTGSQSIAGTKTFTDTIFINSSINSDGGTIQVNVDSLNVDGAISATDTITATRFTSTQATGTAPLTVASTTAVTNLNADLLDGNHASAFLLTSAVKEQLKYLYIYGKAQSAITKGQAVQFAGVQGDHILMKAAVPSEINTNPDYFIGLAETTLATNDFGYVLTQGELVGVNTSTYTAGNILWFASAGSTAGALTATEPTNSNSRIQVASVNKVNATEGILFVRVNFVGTEVEDIVATGTPSSTTFLRGDGQWVAALPLAGGTIDLNSGTTSRSITFNTAQTFTGPYLRGSVQSLQRGYYTDQFTIWDAGNDGAGSGLDADTVDGIQASSFPIAVEAVKTTSTSASSGVTPVSVITFSLDANSNYAININGMWSKSYGGSGSFGTVVSIAVDNATGTPTWNGVYEWAASPSATSLTIESESANITTSATAHGWTAGVSTASVGASFFRINGRIFTGTSAKTLTLYVAKSVDQTGGAVINSANGVAIKL
jgi:hypothetical protein